jgi:hypothetical protein
VNSRQEGKKEVLGLWIAEHEGAKFWASVLNEIRNQGTEDMLIACMDGLTGFPNAVRVVFPGRGDTAVYRTPGAQFSEIRVVQRFESGLCRPESDIPWH